MQISTPCWRSLLNPQQAAIAPVPTAEQIRIGIVSGHWGHDSGAVCDNGTTEQQVNLAIATLVATEIDRLWLSGGPAAGVRPAPERIQGGRPVIDP